jgi:hypothetical protein
LRGPTPKLEVQKRATAKSVEAITISDPFSDTARQTKPQKLKLKAKQDSNASLLVENVLEEGRGADSDSEKDATEETKDEVNNDQIMKSSLLRGNHLKKIITHHKTLSLKLLKEITNLVGPTYEADKDKDSPHVVPQKYTKAEFNGYDVPSGVSLFHSGRPSLNVNHQSIQHQFKSTPAGKTAKPSSESEEVSDLWTVPKTRLPQKKKEKDEIIQQENNYFGANHMDELQCWDSIDMKSATSPIFRPASTDGHTIIFQRSSQKLLVRSSANVAPVQALGGLGPDKSDDYQNRVPLCKYSY